MPCKRKGSRASHEPAVALRHGKQERPAYFAVAGEMELRSPVALPEALPSESELARFRALRFPLKQQGFLLGRLAAKRALSALLAEPDLRRIEIQSGVFGQPMVRHPRAGAAEVTVSHSHGLAAALAFPGDTPVGVDLETAPAVSARTILGELQVSEPDKAWMAASAVELGTACGVLWAAREALGKSMKIGLNCPPGIRSLDHLEYAGATAWSGRYAHFPQSWCLSQAIGDRVLSLAMPKGIELRPWPRLR